jgi:hypothetical protein
LIASIAEGESTLVGVAQHELEAVDVSVSRESAVVQQLAGSVVYVVVDVILYSSQLFE